MLDFTDSPEEAHFRAELRDWYATNLPDPEGGPAVGRLPEDEARAWSRSLFDGGYVGITWPVEYGGRGLPLSFQGVFLEEQGRSGAPAHLGTIGLGMAGPTIMHWGSDEQKQAYLAPLLTGEEIWCQGFSEPGSGSDLAGARTRADLDGDQWVVNGQKIWSSYAHLARWCMLLTRTDRTSSGRHGLSYLLLDMTSPGVEVRPLTHLTGDAEFNEIFLTDVRIPRQSILGDPGQGWEVAMTTLLHERGTMGFSLTAKVEQAITLVLRLANETGADQDELIRDRLAKFWVTLQALRYNNYRSLAAIEKSGVPGPESSIAKLVWSETNQAVGALAQEINGLAGQLQDSSGVWRGYWSYHQLRSRANTIEAGTSEILRNIIAERVLGLPRSR